MPSQTLDIDIRVRRGRGADGAGFELAVAFRARPGITILFGPSGAGKTTVLQAVAGLLRPSAGRVALGEQVWFDADARVDRPVEARRVAYVFQSLALFPHLTARANVAYGMPRDRPRKRRAERADALLDRLGVAHLAGRKPRTFSGGEAQRVALARALAMSPQVILLDEPFSAVDRELRIQLASLVRELVDEYQVPLIQVTHHHGEARAMGDWVVHIAHGTVVEQGTVHEVLRDDALSAAAWSRVRQSPRVRAEPGESSAGASGASRPAAQ